MRDGESHEYDGEYRGDGDEQQAGGDDDDVVEHRRPGRGAEDPAGVEHGGGELLQRDLADRIAYHRSYLSQVERGRQVPAEQFVNELINSIRHVHELDQLVRR